MYITDEQLEQEADEYVQHFAVNLKEHESFTFLQYLEMRGYQHV